MTDDYESHGEMEEAQEELAKAIGGLVIWFNDLERAMGKALACILNQEERTGAVFSAHLSAAAMIKLLQALDFKLADGPIKEEFSQLLRHITELNADRNRIVHSEYWFLPDEKSYGATILHRKLRDAHLHTVDLSKPMVANKHVREVNAEEIEGLAGEVSIATQNLDAVIKKLELSDVA